MPRPLSLSPDVIRRFDRRGPRYTSYPPADRFGDLDEPAYVAALARADARTDDPLSLYVHLPFCERLCAYCGCNMVVTRNADKRARYLATLAREVDLVVAHLPTRRRVSHLHLGGGTPNAYSPAALGQLVGHLRDRFRFDPDAELAIEVDPRHLDADGVRALRAVGFTRLSVGVQDLDPAVQRAVDRVCPADRVAEVVAAARDEGLRGTNVDLIYGLPMQRLGTWRDTIDRVVALAPDRISLYSFAFIPWLKRQQVAIPQALLPSPGDKLALFCHAREAFLAAGYVAIGMDHFARPDDALACALESGRLHRNFQGYTTDGAPDMLGFGVSAIGDVDDTYVQNEKSLRDYEARVAAGALPVARGLRRSEDDEARRFIIARLMCDHHVSDRDLRAATGRRLARDYVGELATLSTAEYAPLCDVSPEHIALTPLGRLFVRVVAAAFDPAMSGGYRGDSPSYSRTI